ncbi:MAG: sigma factor, partial [Bacteroidota bacterium]
MEKSINKMKISDEELIRHYLDTQNSKYFDQLYSKYATKVFSKCISLLKDEAGAQDATQDIFLKIFLNLSKFSGKSKFSTWIYSITYN